MNYAKRYPESRPPSTKYFKKIIENLRRTGYFDKQRERIKTVVTEEVETDIIAIFHANPKSSVREAERLCGVSRFSISSILKKHKFYPHKFTVVQALLPGDEERRIEFCAWTAEISVHNSSFLSHILVIWTGETNVSNSGMMNRTNNHLVQREPFTSKGRP